MTCNLVSHWGKPRAKSKAVWPFAVFTAGSAWAASSKRIMPWSPHLDAAWIGYNFSGQFDLSFTPAKPCWCRKRWSRSCLRCFRWSLWDGLEIRKPESESEVSSDLVALIDSSLESALEELVFPVALTKLVFPQVTSLTLQAGLGASASVKRSPISISMESAATQSSRINMGGWSVAVSCMFPIFIAAKVDSGTGQTFKQVLELMSVNEFCVTAGHPGLISGKKQKVLNGFPSALHVSLKRFCHTSTGHRDVALGSSYTVCMSAGAYLPNTWVPGLSASSGYASNAWRQPHILLPNVLKLVCRQLRGKSAAV